MARTLSRPQRLLFIAIAVTFALAFMPISWLWWMESVARVVTLPMTPVRQVGVSVGEWLRPPADPRLRAASTQRERLLAEQLDEVERLYQAAELRARELQEQLEQIMLMPLDDMRVPFHPVVASITGRNPRSPTAQVELNRGRDFGLQDGTIAAYGGSHLIGRVVSPGQLRSHLLPITNVNSDYIRARVMPRDRLDLPISAAPVIDLEPRGDGSFIADAEHSVPIEVGDMVRLDDRRWPMSAQAMVVGFVDAIRPNDTNSLLQTLIVRPRYHASELAHVTLKVEVDTTGSSRQEAVR